MKLAEALALRADADRRADQLRSRILANARYQEGEPPSEDAESLLAEADTVLGDLETLIRRINRTNAAVDLGDGTITDALARRDALRARHSLLTAAADAAAGKDQRPQYGRQLRSELKMLAALPVAQLRRRADQIARDVRQLDLRIQRADWEHDLLE
jgi:hypothetical protein